MKADKFQVESFTKDEKDLAARKAELKDINDDYCAIIKVRTNVDGILFKTYPDITKIEYKSNPKEIWLYVSPGIKLITMSGTGFITQEYVIPNSIKVESLSVYVMVVNGVYDFTGVNTNDLGYFKVISNPPGAQISMEGNPAFKEYTPYDGLAKKQQWPIGKKRIFVELKDYNQKDTVFLIEKDKVNEININLVPAYSYVDFKITPKNANSNKDTWAPDSLSYFILSMNEVRLSWVQSENRIDGYVIDKYSHNQWINNFAFVQKNENYWIDTNYFYEPQSIIKYRVSTIAGNNKSQTRELEILPSLPEIAIKEIIKENNTLIIGVDIVKQDPNSELLGYGICYSNHPNPIFGDCNLSEKVNDSVFRLNLITANTGDVYIRAYAHSVFGIAYSEDTLVNIVYDARDGNAYKTVKIGNQIWLAENLKYLPSVVGPGTESESTPYYYVYGYNGTNVTDAKATSNYATYGVLYNWTAAMDACPDGWHLRL
ncbi:MAG: FISUMP domain-containing protein [Bacteroidales bacterium]